MAPRLLTLLGMIETALANQGAHAVASPPERSVSFHKGMARMNFFDGTGSILLQNFTLADGQICVKALFIWGDGLQNGSYAIYPRDGFDWPNAADQIAKAWMSSRPQPAAATKVTTTEEGASGENAVTSEIAAG